jgi:serine/threonine protein kinase/Flp pilus assembly protein TadD
MNQQEWQRVKETLGGALDRAEAERATFLDDACAGDPELRRQVEALLRSEATVGDFLLEPLEAVVAVAEAGIVPPGGDEFGTGDGIGSDRRIGPYRIVREIGRGGMGVVYLAARADGQFRKQVALKLIQAHLGAEEVVRRFRTERQVLATLEHPNIARLLDGGATEDGSPYLVMEYVEGEPIDRWCETRAVPERRRIELLRSVCDAVQYAHAQGIIHRDLKPGNILVTAEGRPKLLDFGIARVTNPELAEGSGETTRGLAPLTPHYASPEQIRGEPATRASDIYSLGLVLYRVVAGHLPRGSPPNLSAEMRSPLSRDLGQVVGMALQDQPERRYGSAADLADDLRRLLQDEPVRARGESIAYRSRKFLRRHRIPLAIGLGSAVAAALLATAVVRHGGVPDRHSIAVLPLENLSGDRSQDYFAEGITDELIDELARIPSLRVISRTSVMAYQGAKLAAPEIARRLRVGTIAEGSVARDGDRIRVAVRLVDARDDRPVWTGRYEGELQDVLSLQTQVAAAIAGEIDETLETRAPGRATRERRVDLRAYDAYLKARRQYLAQFDQASMEKAIALFRQALSFDPTYAPAYAGVANCYYMLSSIYRPPSEVMPQAKAAALKALELDPSSGEARATLALIESLYDFDRGSAEKDFRRAIELKPSDANAHLWYAIHLSGMARFDEAAHQAEQARRLDPASPAMNIYGDVVLYFARRYDDAIRRLQTLADLYPDDTQLHAFLALAYEQQRRWDQAIPQIERAYEIDKDQDGLAQLGHIYAASGRTADARRVLAQLEELRGKRYVSAYNIGVLYAGLGERDEAFRWLEQVEQDRSEWFAMINVDPRLEELHGDPRFAGILKKVGLGP